MKIIRNASQMQKIAFDLLKKNKTVGFVPTMGALHSGHISLIKKSVLSNDVTVVSIFVNPIQFGSGEDYSKYPRPYEKDILICKTNKVDFLFMPEKTSLYDKDFATYVNVEKVSGIMCGASRKGHFKGVATVVAKLLNIVMPANAYFGLKDYQQFIIIKKMAGDLNINTKITGCPIVREKSGLAMSSRNAYLSEKDRDNAKLIFQSLREAKKLFKSRKPVSRIINVIKKTISKIANGKIEYIEVKETGTLEDITKFSKDILIAVAVRVSGVRLIDNIICKK